MNRRAFLLSSVAAAVAPTEKRPLVLGGVCLNTGQRYLVGELPSENVSLPPDYVARLREHWTTWRPMEAGPERAADHYNDLQRQIYEAFRIPPHMLEGR